MKKRHDLRKTSLLIIFLIISTPILAYPFLFLSTYVHESGHVMAAKKQGLSFTIKKIDYIPDINNLNGWGYGKATPLSTEDCERFNSLPEEDKSRITHEGVMMEIWVFLPLVFASSILLCLFWKSIANKSNVLLVIWLVITLVLVVIIVWSIRNNVLSANPQNDWNFISFSNCSMFS